MDFQALISEILWIVDKENWGENIFCEERVTVKIELILFTFRKMYVDIQVIYRVGYGVRFILVGL